LEASEIVVKEPDGCVYVTSSSNTIRTLPGCIVCTGLSSRRYGNCSVGEFAWCCPVVHLCHLTLSALWTYASAVLSDKAMVSLKPVALEPFKKVF